MNEHEILFELANALREAQRMGGWAATIPVLLMGIVNIWKSETFQGHLPVRFQWKNLPLPAQIAVVFFLSALGATVTAALSGATLSTALINSIWVGLTAI